MRLLSIPLLISLPISAFSNASEKNYLANIDSRGISSESKVSLFNIFYIKNGQCSHNKCTFDIIEDSPSQSTKKYQVIDIFYKALKKSISVFNEILMGKVDEDVASNVID